MDHATDLAPRRVSPDLLSLLGRGEDQAVRGEFLAATLAISERSVRDLVETLRRDGHLIGSSSRGYFLISSWDELEATARHIRSRALSMLATKSAMEHAAAEQFGPEALRLFAIEEVPHG